MTEDVEQDKELIERLAQKIVEKRLETAALFFLEMSRPLSFLAGQAMIFLGPIVQAVYPVKDYARIAALMEKRENVDLLIDAIEQEARDA
ncbi:MAG: hypothetical protein ACYTG7_03685 [Planctomycetota bacterium]|jgi:hypothetical protein